MKNQKKTMFIAGMAALTLVFAFVLSACDSTGGGGTRNYKSVAFDLQGTWVSNDPSLYNGKLVIKYDSITITLYSEGQTKTGGNDTKRPFRNFTKGTALEAYTEKTEEEGKYLLFIKDAGRVREGIPCFYWEGYTYPHEEFLRFEFGGREEILKKQKD